MLIPLPGTVNGNTLAIGFELATSQFTAQLVCYVVRDASLGQLIKMISSGALPHSLRSVSSVALTTVVNNMFI